MRLPKESIQYLPGRRVFAGAAVLVFLGIFFALPLYSALTLCTMPCCEHDKATKGAVVSTAPTPCATDCAIRAGEATAVPMPAIAPEKRAEERLALPAIAAVGFDRSALVAAVDHRPTAVCRRAGASLNVLNSVFRI